MNLQFPLIPFLPMLDAQHFYGLQLINFIISFFPVGIFLGLGVIGLVDNMTNGTRKGAIYGLTMIGIAIAFAIFGLYLVLAAIAAGVVAIGIVIIKNISLVAKGKEDNKT